MKLGHASNFAVIRNSKYEWKNEKGNFIGEKHADIELNLEAGGQLHLGDNHELTLSVHSSGNSANYLLNGMYYVETFANGTNGDVIQNALNERSEHK